MLACCHYITDAGGNNTEVMPDAWRAHTHASPRKPLTIYKTSTRKQFDKAMPETTCTSLVSACSTTAVKASKKVLACSGSASA